MTNNSPFLKKAAIIKQAFGEEPNTKYPIAKLDKNVIIPAISAVSHKYTFILESLIDVTPPFTVADYTGTNGLFACLLAQDFNDSCCSAMISSKKNIEILKQLQNVFEIPNLKIKTANINKTKYKTDITIHDVATLTKLSRIPPQHLAQQIATTTSKYTIIDIPSQKDPELRHQLKDKFPAVDVFFRALLEYYWIITFVPVIYDQNTIRACYLLQKK